MTSHKTFIFFVPDDGEIKLMTRMDYVRLLRGEGRLLQHANKAVRVADWYAELHDGRAATLVNETYSVLQLDERGAVDWPRCRVGRSRNQALYEALRSSSYDDPDDDPAVQKLQAKMCDEVAWLPNPAERNQMQRLLEAA